MACRCAEIASFGAGARVVEASGALWLSESICIPMSKRDLMWGVLYLASGFWVYTARSAMPLQGQACMPFNGSTYDIDRTNGDIDRTDGFSISFPFSFDGTSIDKDSTTGITHVVFLASCWLNRSVDAGSQCMCRSSEE